VSQPPLNFGFSVPTADIVQIRLEIFDDQHVCVITVAPSVKKVFTWNVGRSGSSNFWVRICNQTKQLHGDGMVTYMNDHWG